MKRTQRLLTQLGLSDKEILLYITGLQIGPALASKLAKQIDVSRPLAYHLLTSLTEKGLVSTSGPKKGKLFTMEPPSRLRSLLERKKREIEQSEYELQVVETELNSLNSEKQSPARVQFYEGAEGMKNVAEETLNVKSKQMHVLASLESITTSLDQPFLEYYLAENDRRRIHRKSIWSKPIAETPAKTSPYRKQKVAPKNFYFPSTIVIFDNKVAIFSSQKEQSAFTVESDEFATTMRAMFERIWESI